MRQLQPQTTVIFTDTSMATRVGVATVRDTLPYTIAASRGVIALEAGSPTLHWPSASLSSPFSGLFDGSFPHPSSIPARECLGTRLESNVYATVPSHHTVKLYSVSPIHPIHSCLYTPCRQSRVGIMLH